MTPGCSYTWYLHNVSSSDVGPIARIIYEYVWSRTPVKTGNMRAHTHYSYDVRSKTITVYNNCIYANYQDTVTSLTGWWEYACKDALVYALKSYATAKSTTVSKTSMNRYLRIIEKLTRRLK